MVVSELCEAIKKQDKEIKAKEEIIQKQNEEIMRLNRELENKNREQNYKWEDEEQFGDFSDGLELEKLLAEFVKEEKVKKVENVQKVFDTDSRGYYDDVCYDLADGDEDLASVIFDNID